jgi:hypothetical protein
MGDEGKKERLPDLQYAKVSLECNHQEKAFCEVRSSVLADEFTKIEVQIAAILFAFVAIFAKFFDSQGGYAGYPDYIVFIIKATFGVIVFALVASLTFGLIELKRKELFWNELMKQKLARYDAWMSVLRGNMALEEAEALHKGTKHNGGSIRHTPPWPWILQTVALGGAVILTLLLLVIFISR